MILTIDIGNTNITIGGFEGEQLVLNARLATETSRTGDQLAVELYDIFRLNGKMVADVTGCAISSVVPGVCSSMKSAIKKLCGIEPIVIGPGVKTGLNIKIDDPAELGADLVAGAVGAAAKYPNPCIIIDLGTAITISAINPAGDFLGIAIAAGVKLTLNALTKNTAQLPDIYLEPPKRAIGRNTLESMQSGLLFGTAALIDGLVQRFEDEIGQKCTIVATGGRAGQIVPLCGSKIIVDENLLLEGLKLIYEKNA